MKTTKYILMPVLVVLAGCGTNVQSNKAAPDPVELGDGDKTDLFGRAVQDGGALTYGEELEISLLAESYLELRFTAAAASRVILDVRGERDGACEPDCAACWLVDPVLQVDGPLVDGAYLSQIHAVSDDRDGCDLDPNLELEVADEGTYRVLVWDYGFQSGSVGVTLTCASDNCELACDQDCPEGSVCQADVCKPTVVLPDETDVDDGDILMTQLEIDVASLSGRATMNVIPGTEGRLVLETGGLEILSVSSPSGSVEHQVANGQLEVVFPETSESVTLIVEYGYQHQDELEGAMAAGHTMTWPYFCSNLFPCQSAPDEGSRFELTLTGVPEGDTAIYPTSIPSDAPAYMLAWVYGSYRYVELGRTASGTRVGFYCPREYVMNAMAGTTHLLAAFEWLETVIGPYTFGDSVASVSVVWGPGAYGGMEHHPFWHISQSSLDSEETNCHEAVHGWFGNGVRIRCWEDFVLSEGTTSYLTARALEATAGEAMAERIWGEYRRRLDGAQSTSLVTIAWPDSCGAVDLLNDGLFSAIPYMKGAFFFRALEGRVGRTALDSALAEFYATHVGRAAGMEDLLDTIASETGYDPTDCATQWLRSEAIPSSEVCE